MTKTKIIFVTGGIKSGKSTFACTEAIKYDRNTKNVLYFATGYAYDNEMAERIIKHKSNRPENWRTIEERIFLNYCLEQISKSTKIIIIDCINFWLANAMKEKWTEDKIINYIKSFITNLKQLKSLRKVYIISNEVGMSLVPVNKLGRKFQELLGKINQIIATNFADEVYVLISGIPLKLKL